MYCTAKPRGALDGDRVAIFFFARGSDEPTVRGAAIRRVLSAQNCISANHSVRSSSRTVCQYDEALKAQFVGQTNLHDCARNTKWSGFVPTSLNPSGSEVLC